MEDLYELDLRQKISFERLRLVVGHLMDNDFSGLLNLLYKYDVEEDLLRKTISECNLSEVLENVTQVLYKRLYRIQLAREEYRQTDVPDADERW